MSLIKTKNGYYSELSQTLYKDYNLGDSDIAFYTEGVYVYNKLDVCLNPSETLFPFGRRGFISVETAQARGQWLYGSFTNWALKSTTKAPPTQWLIQKKPQNCQAKKTQYCALCARLSGKSERNPTSQ